MAKSIRSSVQKRNRAKLRATVFGPAVDARTARLSAKLQELAAQPRPKDTDAAGMEVDNTTDKQDADAANHKGQNSDAEMDIDGVNQSTTKTHSSKKNGRVQKRRNKKPRSSIVFPRNPHKEKRASKRK
ncbi:hypothetical protein DTO166G4_1336 [Paecilomyces variotii]|uniref:DUF2423 domain-containing protein n=1 Tax=Byssochlamys spectabilis TaxID=264951 RepID=A0A443HLW5_BYSSP|nr:hypothetical protein C8Q69DRAFT_529997 [Paecilomyces variotii]KAJ9208118.1 hypothetical protein DTO032I3_789 [Paecilomyces variotii]KAJ9216876.1 hypothetical protein DTO166G4_1336 [Paecilomyces variotii]KAJ9231000.1 hypothetical protein DTO169E5_8168 [Paecilomyces variotii]KAJ9258467.1 hypothetical protein DTO207G8_1642 [Paecilomyces variotii]KAJ9266652.1 hypothetical protein DTO195F2_1175 [Paecilomyces variotii]